MTDQPALDLFSPTGPPHIVENINSIVGAAFRAANAKRARSSQKALGMSELGGCRRQAGFKILNIEPSNPSELRTDKYADSREAMIGTMIHETILPQIQAMSLTAEIEVPVVLHFDGLPDIPGSSDLIDQSVGLILDLKGLALDTPIPTPSGWTTMAALQIGDQVFDRYGNPCTVTQISEVKNLGCYRVDFNGVGSIVCDEEHIWVARSGSLSWKKNLEVHPRSISDLEQTWLNGENVAVPMTKPLELPEVDLPIDPWMLGYWLGNGTKSNGGVSCHNDDAEDICNLIDSSGYTTSAPRPDKRGSLNTAIVAKGLMHDLVRFGILGNKHVPDVYLRGSRDQRLSLLQGLMDSDGTWHRKRNRAVFTTTDRPLAEAVREIVASLGWRAQWQNVVRTGFGKTVMSYDVHFTPWDMNPFRLKRKADLVVVPAKKDRRWHQIRGIERIASVPTKCIAVDSEDRTYLAGEAMIPTHNTSSQFGVEYIKSRGPSKKHLWQTHGYATAAIQAGIPIDKIALVYIDRADGQVVYVHYQDYDPTIVTDIEEWWREVNSTDDPFTLPRDEKGPGLSKMCDWCQWLNACWGPDAVPGEKGVQKIVLEEVPPSQRRDEVEEYLRKYKEAADREKAAGEEKKFAREVLVGAESGIYGSMVLKWGRSSTYEQLDGAAAEAALTAAGLPVPKVERSRDARIDVKRTK